MQMLPMVDRYITSQGNKVKRAQKKEKYVETNIVKNDCLTIRRLQKLFLR